MKNKGRILFTGFVTHDVMRFIVEKPEGFEFTPGQATEVAIAKDGWEDKKRPFTFTSLADDEVLEFIIKGYPVKDNPEHSGMTEKLHTLKPGDELLFDDPWGTIEYKGPGVFIAGGAGITPFIAIIRDLKVKNKLKGNKLFFSNKTAKDIILEKELREAFGDELLLTLTREKLPGYSNGRINKNFLGKYVKRYDQNFYVCGPKKMVEDIKKILDSLGASSDSLVFEE
ncbi:flavodoxin reductase [Candidatus Woesebacteria bacterium]|nr:flavodoxin reductase [Candidatus Woesebacteria bacterium]